MAFGNGKRQVTEITESPVKVYLDYQKGQLVNWDKEKGMNIIHPLNRFVILDIGYCFRGKEWNDTLKTFTATYYSNEIKDWEETIYIIKMIFVNKQAVKNLLKAGKWKEIKEEVKIPGTAINLALTVLDLDDYTVKQLFLSGTNFYNVSSAIKDLSPNDILSFKSETVYVNQKDKTEITLEQLDKLKGSEAANYKARYNVSVVKTGEYISDDEVAKDISNLGDRIDEYHISQTERYRKEYGVYESKFGNYFQPGEDTIEEKKEVIENKNFFVPNKVVEEEEILSIESIPF